MPGCPDGCGRTGIPGPPGAGFPGVGLPGLIGKRSEERRVGKEC